VVRDSTQLQQLIALGRTVALLPASTEHLLGTELTYVPISDAPTSTLAIAWAEDSRSRPLATLIQAAVNCAPR
jgi:DNA-binding transcriptional LysR family regulator